MDPDIQPPRRRRGLLALLGDFARWLLMLTLFAGAALAAGMYFIQHHLDEQIRTFVESKFQTNYDDLVVSVRSARRVAGHGIEIRGLRIARQVGGRIETMASVDELFVECSTALADLAGGQANARRVVVQGAKLRMIREADGGWSISQLLPLPSFGDNPPPLLIRNATVDVVEPATGGSRQFKLRDIDLNVLPQKLATVDEKTGKSLRRFDFAGTCSGEHFEHAEFTGHVRPDRSSWSIAGSLRSLEVSTRSLNNLPNDVRQHIDVLQPASGRVSFSFDATQAGRTSPVGFTMSGQFTGRIEDTRIPQPLTDVRVPFHASDQGLTIRDATARAGRTVLRLSGSLDGFSSTSPYHIRAKAEQLVLDDQFPRLLPERMQDLWAKYAPQGLLDVNVELHSDGHRVKHFVVADLLDTSFAFHKFPYRVHHGRGQIRFRDDLLVLDGLVASANGRPVQVSGEIRKPGKNQLGWVEVLVDEPLPLDEQLIESLQGEARQHVKSFHPRGAVTGRIRFDRQSLDQPPRWQFNIGLHNCSVRYDRFRYPFYNIQGELSMVDKHWTVRIDQAQNNSAQVTCNGGWRPDPRGGIDLTLDFNARAIAIEDELRDALPASTRGLWKSLQPRGTLDEVKVRVHLDAGLRRPSIQVAAYKWPNAEQADGSQISVKPTWLPYRWDHVAGSVHYKDGVTELQRVKGLHGPTSIELNGVARSLPHGRWQVDMSRVNVDSLRATPEFVAALPAGLRRAIVQLGPTEPLNLTGGFRVSGVEGRAQPTHSQWDVTCDVAGTRLNCGVPLEHVHGQVRLAGKLDEHGHYSRGHIELDSLVHKGVQLTRVHGPLSIDDTRVAVGEKTHVLPGEPAARPLSAETVGGTLTGSGQVWFTSESWFEVDATLFDADLNSIAREMSGSATNLSGRTFGQIKLSGICDAGHTLQGSGRVQLRKADIYELPPMIRLLSVLRVKPPDDTAFTTSDIDFRVVADRIYFDKINFDGDAISLDGRGEMTFDRQLNVAFETYAGPNDRRDWLIRPLLKEVGRNLVLIRVSGPLENPDFDREAIPGVNRVLEQMFPAAGQPAAVTRLPQPPRTRR